MDAVGHKADGSWRRSFGVAVLLAVLSGLIYGQALSHDFVNFDDDIYIVNNPGVTGGLTPAGVAHAFSIRGVSYWHPVTMLSLMTDYHLFGASPVTFHAVNILLHMVNAVLVFLLVQALTGAFWRSAWVAALFAVHPLNVESVAWAVERKNVLSAAFGLLSILAYVRYARGRAMGRGWGAYGLSLGCMALGLMSKTTVAVVPVLLLLLDVWPLNRLGMFDARPGMDRPGRLRRAGVLLLEKLPFVLLALAAGALMNVSIRALNIVVSSTAAPMSLRISNALVSYVKYICRLFWPSDLGCFYPFPAAVSAGLTAAATLVLVGITVYALRGLKRRPMLALGWGWYVLALGPASGLVQAGLWPEMADRFVYVPMIGLLLMVVWGAHEVAERFGRRGLHVAAALGVLAVAALTAQAWRQTGYWRDTATLFSRVLDVDPANYFAHNNLGNALARQGRVREAVAHYEASLKGYPGHAEAWNNLGAAQAFLKERERAEQSFREAIRLKPGYADAHVNLGILLAAAPGRQAEALASFRRAAELQPSAADIKAWMDKLSGAH